MAGNDLKEIRDIRKVRLVDLDNRLRNVRLKGFPDVKIYEDADISIERFSPKDLIAGIFTPQPTVYRDFIKRINRMAELFLKEGVDIFRLEEGYDYTAVDSQGIATNWTLIPPVVEVVPVSFTGRGLSYSNALGSSLKEQMAKEGHKLNPELEILWFSEFGNYSGTTLINIICDGSNRIQAALERELEQNLLVINGPKVGFPYYATPKPYSMVHVEAERVDGSNNDKTHVLTEPGHKLLYRLFPSGGLHTGDVRKPITS